jgi:hypothetical protein
MLTSPSLARPANLPDTRFPSLNRIGDDISNLHAEIRNGYCQLTCRWRSIGWPVLSQTFLRGESPCSAYSARLRSFAMA